MPYIKLDERSKFKPHIQQVLSVLTAGNESPYVRGEYFGYFVNRLVRHYLNDPVSAETTFNSLFFNEANKRTLQSGADHIGALLNRSDPLESAGDLNYAISSVYWGFLGAAQGVDNARYGMRAYLTGILQKIYSSIESVNVGNQRDMTMAFRRHLIARGVIQHVLIEEYRRNTSLYENEKIRENGDVWKDGKLVVPEAQPE